MMKVEPITDNLQGVLRLQMMFQNMYHPKAQKETRNEQLIMHTDALLIEAVEVKMETNWKTWKKPKELDWDKIKDEIVDEFIFMLNQCNIAEMDADELIDRTIKKVDVNIKRQENGY